MIVGLTGVFACGKSTVAKMMEAHGAAVIEADELGRRVVQPGGPVLAEIERRFGPAYLLPDGSLDRRRMAETVFSDPDKRRLLNAIVHPAIRAESDRLSALLQRSWRESGWPACIVHNAALLFECDLTGHVDQVVVVWATEAQIFHRARRRDGLSEREVVRRLASQMSQREKIARADLVIDNRGDLDETRRQVAACCEKWTRALPARVETIDKR